MFILYSMPVGLLLGLALGGRPAAIGRLQFRWAGLALLGFAAQVVLFSDPVSARIGSLGPPLYVVSTAVVLVAVLRNLAIRGMPIVALGAVSNLVAIVANGGYMPTGLAAAAAFGREPGATYSNSQILASPALEPLTDVIALPSWLPFTNIISVGDILIGVGVTVVIAAAMRLGPEEPAGGPSVRNQPSVTQGNSPI